MIILFGKEQKKELVYESFLSLFLIHIIIFTSTLCIKWDIILFLGGKNREKKSYFNGPL